MVRRTIQAFDRFVLHVDDITSETRGFWRFLCDLVHTLGSMLSLYCDSKSCLQTETGKRTERVMEKEFKDIPLSQSNVSLKLADIQKRCSEMLKDSADALELTLEEPVLQIDDSNPYDRG